MSGYVGWTLLFINGIITAAVALQATPVIASTVSFGMLQMLSMFIISPIMLISFLLLGLKTMGITIGTMIGWIVQKLVMRRMEKQLEGVNNVWQAFR